MFSDSKFYFYQLSWLASKPQVTLYRFQK